MSSPFQNKVIAISGGASGIGLETAQTLAAQGAILSLADYNSAGLDAARKLLQVVVSPDSAHHMTTVVDVRNSSEVDSWIRSTYEKYGRLDGAVNAAGIAREAQPIREETDRGWESVMAVNATGLFYCLRAQLRLMGEGGAIVNISSVAGATGFPGCASYCASKHAVLGLTRTAARENSTVRVNAVLPGIIDTPMTAELTAGRGSDMPTAHLALKRLGTTQEVAAMVVFLLSDRASFVTGGAYPVDGGWLC